MPGFKGYTWDLSTSEIQLLQLLLLRYRAGHRPLAVDESLIEMFLLKIEFFLEVDPNGTSSTSYDHGRPKAKASLD